MEQVLRVLPDAANADGEFAIAARMWDADVVFVSDSDAVCMSVHDGVVTAATPVAPSHHDQQPAYRKAIPGVLIWTLATSFAMWRDTDPI